MVVCPISALSPSVCPPCCISNVLVLAKSGHYPSLSDVRKGHRAKSDPAETRWELWGAAQGGGTPQYQSIFLSHAMINFS